MVDTRTVAAVLLELAVALQGETDDHLREALDLANGFMGTELAVLSRVYDEVYEVVSCGTTDPRVDVGGTMAVRDTYCAITLAESAVVGFTDFGRSEYGVAGCYHALGLETYIGVPVHVNGALFGTLCFAASAPRAAPWSESEHTLVRLMGKWMEQALERRHARLELERRNTALRRSNEDLDLFTHAVAHDLREPLRAVAGYLSVLERTLGARLEERERHFLGAAREGADRMDKMIRGLRQLTRVDSPAAAPAPCDLGGLIEVVLDDLEPQITDRGATVTNEVSGVVEGEAPQLQRLFQNLVVNALRYSGASPPRIEIRSEASAEWLTVSVRDWGVGIDPRERDAVFVPFRRGSGADAGEGTGLGLTLCKRIVEWHHGEIRVVDVDVGTRIEVRLPR